MNCCYSRNSVGSWVTWLLILISIFFYHLSIVNFFLFYQNSFRSFLLQQETVFGITIKNSFLVRLKSMSSFAWLPYQLLYQLCYISNCYHRRLSHTYNSFFASSLIKLKEESKYKSKLIVVSGVRFHFIQ